MPTVSAAAASFWRDLEVLKARFKVKIGLLDVCSLRHLHPDGTTRLERPNLTTVAIQNT